ncbi:stealth family protein [Pseudomonas sp. PLMAX]|uniref:stealth family protein n=1 Tax=Pseudomonas sp. PLMAX TaxID=2201998 RepID=UPI0038BE1BB7
MSTSVDLVITWVDGSDPSWRNKRHEHSKGNLEGVFETGNVEGRYRDNDELRYLLRSIEKFWPFEGSIFLVTDNQRPAFLADHPRVRIVDHTEILESQYLPTFSSRSIESALHKIPGISEHFVAFNDDLLLMRQVSFDDFFANNGCTVYLTDEDLPRDLGVKNLTGESDAIMAQKWGRAHYGTSPIEKVIEHNPKGIRKSWMEALESKHPEIFHNTRSEKFRAVGAHSILANLYGVDCAAQGRAEFRTNECLYFYTDDVEKRDLSVEMLAGMNRKLAACINDTTDNRDDVDEMRDRLRDVYEACFPEPSGFEFRPPRPVHSYHLDGGLQM